MTNVRHALVYPENKDMSFFCPHFNPDNEHCDRVRDHCIPGRTGCVLARNSTFAVSAQARINAQSAALPPAPPLPPLHSGRKTLKTG